MFGSRALNTTIPAPPGPPHYGDEKQKLTGFPPQPERFVGRVTMMTHARVVLAPKSGIPGVLLCGMAGAGKTACALELAYTHQDAFQALVWYTAPRGDADIGDSLVRFTEALEAKVPAARLSHLLEDPAALDQCLPTLAEIAESSRVLVVIDNAQTLISPASGWRDKRWGHIVNALTSHQGLSRLIVTSQHQVAIPGVRIERVHALSRDEAVLLARDLPQLRALIDGEVPGIPVMQGREAVARVLAVVQGHPKLLELADGQATNLKRLEELVEAADAVWLDRSGGPSKAFFTDGQGAGSGEDDTAVLSAWTRAVVELLPEPARIFFRFLCALEEADRIGGHLASIIEHTWANVWRRTKLPADPPAPGPLIQAVADRALAATHMDRDVTVARIHPVVAAATQDHTPPGFQAAVDTEMGAFWTAIYHAAERDREGVEASGGVLLAARSTIPYLLRQGNWRLPGSFSITSTAAKTHRVRLPCSCPSPATLPNPQQVPAWNCQHDGPWRGSHRVWTKPEGWRNLAKSSPMPSPPEITAWPLPRRKTLRICTGRPDDSTMLSTWLRICPNTLALPTGDPGANWPQRAHGLRFSPLRGITTLSWARWTACSLTATNCLSRTANSTPARHGWCGKVS